jgi:hypothetical protein
MTEFILKDGSMLVLCEEVELLDITLLSDPQIRRLAVPVSRFPHEQVSPSDPSKADLFNPAGPGARAGFFSG